MNPFEYMQALTELWGRGGAGLMGAQQNVFRETAERMTKAAGVHDAGSPYGFMPDGAALAGAGQTFSRLWSSALELSNTVADSVKAGAPPDPLVTQMLGKIFDPRLWFSGADDMDQSMQRLTQGPRLADLWENERKFLEMFNAWVALRKASLAHNTIMLDAWMQAAGRFAKELNGQADKGGAIGSWRDVLALWVETANQALLETQRSEAYLQAQREVLKASTDLRLAQQRMAEVYGEMFGYPTRAEIDDVHKAVTQLRRDLRALQRQGRMGARSGSAARGAATRSPKRRKPQAGQSKHNRASRS